MKKSNTCAEIPEGENWKRDIGKITGQSFF